MNMQTFGPITQEDTAPQFEDETNSHVERSRLMGRPSTTVLQRRQEDLAPPSHADAATGSVRCYRRHGGSFLERGDYQAWTKKNKGSEDFSSVGRAFISWVAQRNFNEALRKNVHFQQCLVVDEAAMKSLESPGRDTDGRAWG